MIINLIQDLATPHNNVLIGAFKDDPTVSLTLWYSYEQDYNRYTSDINITHEHFKARIYGKKLNLKFISYCLKKRKEKYIIVGWMNQNTRLLLFLFFVLRRPFNYWTDMPNIITQKSLKERFFRWFAYNILKYAKCNIFAVGMSTTNYFRTLKFAEKRIINLPIFVSVYEDLHIYKKHREKIFLRYAIDKNDFVLSAGSRLIYDKGYDLLIRAMTLLDLSIQQRIKLIIVGCGEMLDELNILIDKFGLVNQVYIENWLSIEDFKILIANSNVFIHPARFDAYGGTTLGMALGRPVIGSFQSGAAVDRIIPGINGFIYQAEDVDSLANYITTLFENADLCQQMGVEAHMTSLRWSPGYGKKILQENVI